MRAAVKQTSDRLIASTEQQVTIIPLTVVPVVGWLLVSILGSPEIPFLGSRKKIKTRDSLTPLIDISEHDCQMTAVHVL